MTSTKEEWRVVIVGAGAFAVTYGLSLWHYNPVYAIPEIAADFVMCYGLLLLQRVWKKNRAEVKAIKAEIERIEAFMEERSQAVIGVEFTQSDVTIIVRGAPADVQTLPVAEGLRMRMQSWMARYGPEKLQEGQLLLLELFEALVGPVEHSD